MGELDFITEIDPKIQLFTAKRNGELKIVRQYRDKEVRFPVFPSLFRRSYVLCRRSPVTLMCCNMFGEHMHRKALHSTFTDDPRRKTPGSPFCQLEGFRHSNDGPYFIVLKGGTHLFLQSFPNIDVLLFQNFFLSSSFVNSSLPRLYSTYVLYTRWFVKISIFNQINLLMGNVRELIFMCKMFLRFLSFRLTGFFIRVLWIFWRRNQFSSER